MVNRTTASSVSRGPCLEMTSDAKSQVKTQSTYNLQMSFSLPQLAWKAFKMEY